MKAPSRYQTGTKPSGVSKGDPKEKRKIVEAPERERVIGTKTGIDLTKEIKQNQRPSQLPKGFNPGGYNAFQSWLQTQKIDGEPFVGNPKLNTNEGKAKYTDWAINEFNTNSPYVKQFPDNKITPQAIRDVQTFHKQSDPNVVVDEIIGSQTSNFRVPTPTVYYQQDAEAKGIKSPQSKEGFIPIKWGDETYVVDASKYSGGKTPSQSDYVPYDEKLHGATLQNIADPNVAKAFNKTAVPYSSSVKAPLIKPLVPKTETPLINGAQMVPGIKGNSNTNVVLPLTKEPNVVTEPIISNTKTNAFVYDHGGTGGTYQQQSDAWDKQQAEKLNPLTSRVTDPESRRVTTSLNRTFVKGGKITKAPKRYADGTDPEGIQVDASGKPVGYSRQATQNIGLGNVGSDPEGIQVDASGKPVGYSRQATPIKPTPIKPTQNIGLGNVGSGGDMTAIGMGLLSGAANSLPSDTMNDPRFTQSEQTNPMLKGTASSVANTVMPGSGAVISGALSLKDAATNKLSEVDPVTGEYKNKNQAIASNVLQGLYKGTPLGQIQTALDKDKTLGEKALSIGTFGYSDILGSKKKATEDEATNVGVITAEKNKKLQDEQARANQQKLQQQLQQREEGYNKGGYVNGLGTGTSDSVKAKIKPGSFIVPAKNAVLGEKVLNHVQGKEEGGEMMSKAEMEQHHKKMMKAPMRGKKADLDQDGGEDVRLSKGEFVFTPGQRKEIISELGEDVLEALAPDAEHGEDEMKNGGLTAAKARIILHDGTIRGKAITDKQRKYFGAISNGHKCGGEVKGYADGTDPEGIKGETERERIERQKLANEKEAKYYKELEKQKEIQLKKLETRKEIEKERKFNKDVYDAAKKQYDDYSNKLKENPLQKKGIRDFSSTSTPELALKRKDELLKKQEELLNNLDKAEGKYKNSESKYKASQKDDSFNPDGTFKEGEVKKMTAPKTILTSGRISEAESNANKPGKRLSDEELSNAPVKTGAQSEKAMGVKTAPGIGTTSVSRNTSKYIAPTGETSQTEVPKEQPVKQGGIMASALESPTDLSRSAQKYEQENPSKHKNADLLKYGSQAAQGIGGLANYILPYQQYKMGKDYLAKTGARPVGQIDPDFQAAVTKAQANAKFGYTPEEQALLDQRNIGALRSGQVAAQNYSGGSAGNAINLSRQAANDYFGRGLQSAIAGKNLQMDKQAQANALIQDKAAMNRQLFGDTMNAWQQNQQAGSSLMGMGLQNMIGANRLNRETEFQNKYAQNSNPYTSDYFNGLNG